nr:hypothetical protein [Tanacetum cinerariifolium]GEZ43962.1 hypothetical protein [Tanacetum cinerariifolium]
MIASLRLSTSRRAETGTLLLAEETLATILTDSLCDGVGSYDWSFQADKEPTNYALMAFTSSSSISSSSSDRLEYDTQVFNSIVFDFDELIRSESDVSVPTSLLHDRYKSGEGYHAFPPPYIRTFMPLKPDLVFHEASTVSEIVPNILNVEPSPTKPKKEMSQSNRPSAPIIKDWVSNTEDDSEGKPMPPHEAPIFV